MIYPSAGGGIDSRAIKSLGEIHLAQAAGSNEKLKEHINSSIWGHEDENSCRDEEGSLPENNKSHNAAIVRKAGQTAAEDAV